MTTATQSETEKKSDNQVTLRVYNTLTRQKEPFETILPGKVGIYLCGPTVYKEAHIGHMVGPVIFDTIKRYLTYNGYDVNWVVNITDVDDKLIAESNRRGLPMDAIAKEMTEDYVSNLTSLGVDQIDSMPTATGHMDEIIDFIGQLVDKGFAYESEGDVYFEVGKNVENMYFFLEGEAEGTYIAMQHRLVVQAICVPHLSWTFPPYQTQTALRSGLFSF